MSKFRDTQLSLRSKVPRPLAYYTAKSKLVDEIAIAAIGCLFTSPSNSLLVHNRFHQLITTNYHYYSRHAGLISHRYTAFSIKDKTIVLRTLAKFSLRPLKILIYNLFFSRIYLFANLMISSYRLFFWQLASTFMMIRFFVFFLSIRLYSGYLSKKSSYLWSSNQYSRFFFAMT